MATTPAPAPEPRRLGVQEARTHLRDLIDAAAQDGEHAVITRHGRDVAVLVPARWYAEHTAAGGDG
jgi:prevent-host-death family protein